MQHPPVSSLRTLLAILFAAAAGVPSLSAQTPAAQTKLAFDRLALHQFEDGPVLAPSYEFLPGETVWFSCRIAGFQVEKKGDQRRVKLAWQMRVLDPEGTPLEKPRAGNIEEGLQTEDKDWKPKFLASFEVPTSAPGGVYRIPVTARDEMAGVEISGQLEFKVRAPAIEPASDLTIRDFRFQQTEDDATPFRPAIYRPGGRLWARFDIVGFKFGDNHRYAVSYGLAIQSLADPAEPKQVFEQPDAAEEAKESFYPQRVVPGMLSLSLDNTVPPGAYALVITVRDKIGGGSTELRAPYEVEK
jgi:hypothetical protein